MSFLTFSQIQSKESENPFWKNVRFGGGMQLSIEQSYTTIGVSPSAIYEFSDKFASGIGVSYLYSKVRSQDVRYNIYGVSALMLYNPINAIQLSTEFEELNIHTNNNGSKSDYWNPALYIGAAYSMNRNVAMGVRYDVLYIENKSIYNNAFNPFIRIYF
ncbi:MAG TPA: hypothetical protein EYG92_03010 [Lutibacter sp.]|nr:hypothetical protein [Lutibacter sp.]